MPGFPVPPDCQGKYKPVSGYKYGTLASKAASVMSLRRIRRKLTEKLNEPPLCRGKFAISAFGNVAQQGERR